MKASRNPIYSLLCLIGLFVISSFLMILVGADFLAFVYIIVYVGAIAVLFLFIIMMINVKSIPTVNRYNSNFFLLLLVPLIVISFIWSEMHQFNWVLFKGLFFKRPSKIYSYESLDHFFSEHTTLEEILLATSNISSATGQRHGEWIVKVIPFLHKNYGGFELLDLHRKAPMSFFHFYYQYAFYYYYKVIGSGSINPVYFPSQNIEAIGLALYAYYSFSFIFCGVVLFIAMIGAITLTKYWRSDNLRQEIAEQILTENTIRKVNMPFF